MYSTAAPHVHSHSLPLSRPPAALLRNHMHPHCDYVLSIDPTGCADRFPRRSCYSLLAPCRCSLCPMPTISVATHLLVSAALLSRRSLCAFAHDTRRSLQTPLADPVARFCLYAYSFSRPPLCLLTTTLSLILCSTHYPHRNRMSSHPHHVAALSLQSRSTSRLDPAVPP